MSRTDSAASRRAEIAPLGDHALLVRFGTSLEDHANRAALAFAARLERESIAGVVEVVPSLVSVLLRYEPDAIGYWRLSSEVGLRLGGAEDVAALGIHDMDVRFDGPDLAEVADVLGVSAAAFVDQHNATPLRVLTTGFAPGFVYCGFHSEALTIPRRAQVRPLVPAGSVLFAAGQTAITATDIPTGWHVIGHTDFRNFVPDQSPPTLLRAGDHIQFRDVT